MGPAASEDRTSGVSGPDRQASKDRTDTRQRIVPPLFLRHRHKPVANATGGENMAGRGRLVLDILAETCDEVIDRARVGVFVQVPDILENAATRHDLSLALDEIPQQIGFHQSKAVGPPSNVKLLRLEIDRPTGKRV